MANAALNLGWLTRLLRPRRGEVTPDPVHEIHSLDRILVMLARRADDVEPIRLLVGRLGAREGSFRCQEALVEGQELELLVLLEQPEGVQAVRGRVLQVQPCGRGFAGRLQLDPGPAEARRLEAWTRKRSRGA